MLTIGPYGYGHEKPHFSSTTKAWDEKGKRDICRIYVTHGVNAVNSIQIGYMEGASFVLSEIHGGKGNRFDTIALDYPDEFLLGVSGSCSQGFFIYSISFITNRRTYGPYGEIIKKSSHPDPTKYGMTFKAEEFYGFHGYSNAGSLLGIGAYIKPSVPSKTTTSTGRGIIKSEPSS